MIYARNIIFELELVAQNRLVNLVVENVEKFKQYGAFKNHVQRVGVTNGEDLFRGVY